jgi:hypothetical protein
MVVLPPLADLRRPANRWQTVFASTMLLAEKSMQNADRRDILATVSMQADEFLPIEARLFRNTEQWIRQPAGIEAPAGNGMSPYDAARILFVEYAPRGALPIQRPVKPNPIQRPVKPNPRRDAP